MDIETQRNTEPVIHTKTVMNTEITMNALADTQHLLRATRRSILIPLMVLVGMLCLWVAAAGAQDDEDFPNPAMSQGVSEDSLFKPGANDTINLFNGNLTVAVPLGSTYPVGPGLSYGLGLTYNSSGAWHVEDKDDIQCNIDNGNGVDTYFFTAYHPYKINNAGMGWNLSLGRLAGDAPASTHLDFDRRTYIQADGHRRGLYESLHDKVDTDPGVLYSNDGSYIRMTENATGCSNPPASGGECHVLEFADGSSHQFHAIGDEPGFLPTYQVDRFGNHLKIDYTIVGNEITEWVLEDSHGRVQKVAFQDGIRGRRVDSVTLTGFGDAVDAGATTYDFVYYDELHDSQGLEVNRHQFLDHSAPCSTQVLWRNGGQPVSATERVDALERIDLPDDSYYEFSYHTTEPGSSVALGGLSSGLASMRVPTGLRFEYRYSGEYGLTSTAYRGRNNVRVPGVQVLGVAEKKRFEDGQLTGSWTYEHGYSQLHSELDNPQLHPVCYQTTDVKMWPGQPDTGQPLLYDRYYFSNARNNFQKFRGVGFTPCIPGTRELYDGPYLSHEAFDGAGTLLRSTYVTYDTEPTNHGSAHEYNVRLRQRIVKYHDDTDGSDPYQVESLWGYPRNGAGVPTDSVGDYDGFGHFRTATTTTNWPEGRELWETFTKYNVKADGTLTGLSDKLGGKGNWVLGTYDETRVTAGQPAIDHHQTRTLYCFDDDGFLTGRRDLEDNDPGREDNSDPNDIVVLYGHDGDGQVVSENYYGGDLSELGYVESNACDKGTIAASYTIEHQYQSGVRSRSAYKEGTQDVLVTLDLTIDPSTGLPSASRDAAGIETTMVFDDLGRLESEKPAGRAWSFHEYSFPKLNDTNADLTYTVRTCPNGVENCSGATALKHRKVDYDRRGQIEREERRMPSEAGGGSRLVYRTSDYDALGRQTRRGEWRTAAGPNFNTLYGDYDRFGRAGTVTAPDGSVTSLVYTGDRVVERTVRVATLPSAETDSTTYEHRDARGQLVRVREPSGTGGTLTDTTYAYDEGGRLISVCMGDDDGDALSGCPSSAQWRSFEYDDRGFLREEVHPELGDDEGNSPWIQYSYDAMGKTTVRSLLGNGLDRNYSYDAAGRLVMVSRPSAVGGDLRSRLLQEFYYAETTPATNDCDGALLQTKQHNWVTVPGAASDQDIAVTETFVYDPNDACRMSKYGVRSSHGEGFRAVSFSMDYTYDDFGNVTHLEYPSCLSPGCLDGTRFASYTYNHGLLESVHDSAFIDPVATVTHHPTAQVHTVGHLNGVTDTYDRSTGVWKPFSQVKVSGFSQGEDWTYGPFHFDGDQNVKRIETSEGDETFVYDAVGRLTSATVQTRDGAVTQTAAYDAFGNLTQLDGATIGVGSDNRLSGAVYDAAGNVRTLGLGTQTYTYTRNALNQITHLGDGTESRSYLYTAGGERLATLDLLRETEEWTPRDLDNRVLTRFERRGGYAVDWAKDYFYANGRQVAAATPEDGREHLRHLHTDHLGTTRLISDDQGVRGLLETYKPFGGYTTTPQAGAEELQFAGHERDDLGSNSAGHLDYMHARYYSATAGRFLAMDPAASYDPTSPQTWNRYSYALNNPMAYVDPDGRVVLGLLKKGVKVAIKGGDVAATFAGAIEDAATVINPDAPLSSRLMAAASLASEIVSPVSVRDTKAGVDATAKIFDGSGGIKTLWKAPQRGRTDAAEEVVQGFDPEKYPGKGPFFSTDKATAQGYQQKYENGLQEINIDQDDYDRLYNEGVIQDDWWENGSVHVPAEGLDKFNDIIKKDPPNAYYTQSGVDR